MKTLLALVVAALLGVVAQPIAAAPSSSTNDLPGWLTQPLSLADAINAAFRQNSAILKSQKDIEATRGIVIQTRAVVLPKLQGSGTYQYNDALESLNLNGNSVSFQRDQNWNAGLRVVQTVFEGGRLRSALRSAKLQDQQALLLHQAVINDTITEVAIAYYNTQLAREQIGVREKSVELLTREFDDTRKRYDAGTVPRFDLLRAEVELSNAKPRLSRARNAWRIAKNNLVNLVGVNLPTNIWENIPLNLSTPLEPQPYQVDLPSAVAHAIAHRPELDALRKNEELAKEGIVSAKAGYWPQLQLFAGYGWRSSSFVEDLSVDVHGWNAGAQVNWNIFDGMLTRGRIIEARARTEKVALDLDDAGRRVDLEVRTGYSTFLEAQEVLESTQKVVEQAEEAMRLANARYNAGTGTQLDVLAAETSLTEARTTKNLALHDYLVARARLERAIGRDMTVVVKTGSVPASVP